MFHGGKGVLAMTRRALFLNRIKAGRRAQHWLEQAIVATDEMQALRDLGLLLCDRIRSGCGGPRVSGFGAVRLPNTATFVGLNRSETLELAQIISLSPQFAWRLSTVSKGHWAQVFGGVALSYARLGDLATVAALVRAGAYLGLRGHWLDEAEMYILDQQRPDGSFGLLASELALLQADLVAPYAVLRLTVEVLWALGETGGVAESLEVTQALDRRTPQDGVSTRNGQQAERICRRVRATASIGTRKAWTPGCSNSSPRGVRSETPATNLQLDRPHAPSPST